MIECQNVLYLVGPSQKGTITYSPTGSPPNGQSQTVTPCQPCRIDSQFIYSSILKRRVRQFFYYVCQSRSLILVAQRSSLIMDSHMEFDNYPACDRQIQPKQGFVNGTGRLIRRKIKSQQPIVLKKRTVIYSRIPIYC